MPNGVLNISHNFAGESGFIIVEWVRSTAQGTPVVGHVTGTALGAQNDTDQTEVFYPAPHNNEQLQVINLPEVWHLVRFWRSADGVSKDILLLLLAGDAHTGATFPINRYEYVVNRGYTNVFPVTTDGIWEDPVENDVGIRDTRLLNTLFWVEERGTGSLLTSEIVVRDDQGGGFDFADPLKQMNDGAVYVVYAISTVETGDDSGLVTEDDIYILDSNQGYNPVTMGGRTIIVDAPTEVVTLTFGLLSGVADSWFKIQTHTGTQRNAVLQLNAGNTADFRKQAVNKIVLGEGEDAEILIKDGVMYVRSHNTNHENLGAVKWAWKQLLNALKADGSLLALVNYPRVAELINSLPASSVVNEVTWQTLAVQADGLNAYVNKGKWMSDGTNFRPPDLQNKTLKALSALDGTVASGRYEHQRVGAHEHLLGNDDPGAGSGDHLVTIRTTGGNLGYAFNSTDEEPDQFKTKQIDGSIEQATNNIGLYPMICI